jgi:hypothetical protein
VNPSDRALCSETLRALSNPEGINQYSKGGRRETLTNPVAAHPGSGEHAAASERANRLTARADKSQKNADHEKAASAHAQVVDKLEKSGKSDKETKTAIVYHSSLAAQHYSITGAHSLARMYRPN